MRGVLIGTAIAVVVAFGAASVVHGATLDEAKALAEKAADYVKVNGKEKGLQEINNPKGQFVKGDLYVVVHDLKGVTLASPMFQGLVGHNHLELKDAAGKYFIKELNEIVRTKGSGWSTYSWTNPATKKVQPKKVWVQRIEGTDMYTVCGIFE